MQVRPAEEADHAAIDALLKAAFPGPVEARLVTALRAADADTLELVAERDGAVCGMVLFSPVTALSADGQEAHGVGLAPVAVAPGDQRRGIGAALIDAGLDWLKPLGVPWCVVLGEPDYYRRFGFEPASRAGWTWSADADGQAGDAFQLLRLQPGLDLPSPAAVHFHAAFDGV